MNLKTHQVDYTQAFSQAILDDPVFMKVPQVWYVTDDGELHQHSDPKYNDTNQYLWLKQNLYGCKQQEIGVKILLPAFLLKVLHNQKWIVVYF